MALWTIHKRLVLVVWSALIFEMSAVYGQAEPVAQLQTTLSGKIVEAVTEEPLAGCRVSLQPLPTGLISSANAQSPTALSADRVMISGSDGSYRFENVPFGEYRLYVSRLGYKSTTIDVQLRRSVGVDVSVGLEAEPIVLEPIVETAQSLFRSGLDPYEPELRANTVRRRQHDFLPSDVRAITDSDILESYTVGETDLYRALKRLPGVTSQNEFAASPLLRGGGYGQTRVFFDGLPLFNPVSALGGLAAINDYGIGSAILFPGYRPASYGEGGAAVIDISPRRAGSPGTLNGKAELSIFGAKLAVDRRTTSGKLGWMFAAQRSHPLTGIVLSNHNYSRIHWFSSSLQWFDAVGSIDYQASANRNFEISAHVKSDYGEFGYGRNVPEEFRWEIPERWTNFAIRAATTGAFGRLNVSHWIGTSQHRTRAIGDIGDFNHNHTISYATIGTRVAPKSNSTQPIPWSLGFELTRQQMYYDGLRPEPHDGWQDSTVLSFNGSLNSLATWGEARITTGILQVQTGIRIELTQRSRGTTTFNVGPRLGIRLQPTGFWTVSAGASRSYQYSQYLGRSRRALGFDYPVARIWALAGDSIAGGTIPSIRTDVGTVGSEIWLSNSWLVSSTAYWRRETGVAFQDPTPGAFLYRPFFVAGSVNAKGIEFSIRKLAGRWTTMFAYSYGSARASVAGWDFPAPGDRRHVFDATVTARAGRGFVVGAAYSAATGLPFTRAHIFDQPCTTQDACERVLTQIEEPNNGRNPNFQSLDLHIDWSHEFSNWRLGVFLQVRNVLNHRNLSSYIWSEERCELDLDHIARRCIPRGDHYDVFGYGVPRIPLIGIRVTF